MRVAVCPSELAEHLRLSVDESHGWAGNELRGSTVANVVDQGLTVGRDPDGNGSVDALRNDTLVEWQGDGERLATEHHLAEEVLTKVALVDVRARGKE